MSLPLITRAHSFAERTAITASEGTFSYNSLLTASANVAAHLLQNQPDLAEGRVAFLTPRGFTYAAVQWGIWRAGGIAVPLCEVHPPHEWAYVLTDARVDIVVAHPDFAANLRPLAEQQQLRFLSATDILQHKSGILPRIDPQRRAMILYTSGTTGRPKGVVSRHTNLEAQITALIEAWGWTENDHILHVLPLHHVHGIMNVLSCALWAGAHCHILPRFDATTVWETIQRQPLSLFMAVPSIYKRLIDTWEAMPANQQETASQAAAQLRLMVSGSAALPVSFLERWQQITGHTLLERYGMTEIGMALSNPLHGPRKPGFVGNPLPQVDVRLVDENNQPVPSGTAGEIQVRGPAVFQEYWDRPEATAEAFAGSWFRTGDTAIYEDGAYRILGRNSVDIIKTGGYKVSALEIEDVLRTHPAIVDCAVVGISDVDWGERVCAAVILEQGYNLDLGTLRSWAKTYLAPYKVPSRLKTLPDLPRNTMGKVTKPAVRSLFETDE